MTVDLESMNVAAFRMTTNKLEMRLCNTSLIKKPCEYLQFPHGMLKNNRSCGQCEGGFICNIRVKASHLPIGIFYCFLSLKQ